MYIIGTIRSRPTTIILRQMKTSQCLMDSFRYLLGISINWDAVISSTFWRWISGDHGRRYCTSWALFLGNLVSACKNRDLQNLQDLVRIPVNDTKHSYRDEVTVSMGHRFKIWKRVMQQEWQIIIQYHKLDPERFCSGLGIETCRFHFIFKHSRSARYRRRGGRPEKNSC